jgi:hypothetical protein
LPASGKNPGGRSEKWTVKKPGGTLRPFQQEPGLHHLFREVLAVGQVINLAPLFKARQIAVGLQHREGIDYFTLEEAEGPAFRLDPAKIEDVIEQGRRAAAQAAPGLALREPDLALCRRMLRRELIHDLAVNLLQLGY